MITSDSKHVEKYMMAFSQLPIPTERLEAIENYLRGNADVETIDQYLEIDLTATNHNIFQEMLRKEYDKRDVSPFMSRLFHVYFSLGKTNAHLWIPRYLSYLILKNTGIDRGKAMAVYASLIAKWRTAADPGEINLVENLGDRNPNILENAMQYQKEENVYERVILSSFYLLFKYGNDSKPVLEQKDKDLLEQIEKYYVDILETSLWSRDPSFSASELKKEFCNEELSATAITSFRNCDYKNSAMVPDIIAIVYLNYPLSPVLTNIMRVYSLMKPNLVLTILRNSTLGMQTGKLEISERVKEFDRIFYMDPKEIILWACERDTEENRQIIAYHLSRNPDLYMSMLENKSDQIRNIMVSVLKKVKPELWERYLEDHKTEIEKEKTELIRWLAGFFVGPYQTLAERYMNGEIPVSELYDGIPDARKNAVNLSVWRSKDRSLDEWSTKVFQRKVHMIYAMLSTESLQRTLSPFYDSLKIAEFWAEMKEEGMKWRYWIDSFADMYVSFYDWTIEEKWLNQALEQIRLLYLEDRQQLLEETAFCGAAGRYQMLKFYQGCQEDCRKEILSFAQDTSKTVKEELLKTATVHPEWEEDVLPLLNSKKGAAREFAIRTLAAWSQSGKSYQDVLSAAMEKEKNAKLLALFQQVLKLEQEEPAANAERTVEDLVTEIHKSGKKRQLAWIYESIKLTPVHKKDGSEASEEYLQAICLSYSTMERYGLCQNAKTLAEELNEEELAAYANQIYDCWMADGAQAKKKWVLYYASIHGGNGIVDKLKRCINDWAQNSRGAIAAEAVQALVLNPSAQALLIVDSISRKFKFRQVKDAAGRAMEFAAAELGLTKEELADRIVPDLGFDEKMERHFDYGERSFTVTITPALEIEVRDESGKKLKNMPSPGKKDDEEKATAAYEAFKQLKKQMKETVNSQKARLELALSAVRFWNVEDWKKLFVENPIMHQFAMGLIWGMYEEGKLKQTFRYMEDGSFNTEDEEEFELPENGKIGLVHPVELTKESIAVWAEQLSDYEIKQPFEQLSRPVYLITEEEKKSKVLERFAGMILSDLSLSGKLLGMNWYRGSVQDGGSFMDFYREDVSLGLGVDLDFSGSYVGKMESEDITVYEARFYKIGAIQRGSYIYEEINDANSILLSEVPDRYFSEIVLQLTKATASSREVDENWKSNK